MENEKLVLVATYGTRAEADLAKGALEDAGFPAMVQADTAGKTREHLSWSGPRVPSVGAGKGLDLGDRSTGSTFQLPA
jgi:hypothetical protein